MGIDIYEANEKDLWLAFLRDSEARGRPRVRPRSETTPPASPGGGLHWKHNAPCPRRRSPKGASSLAAGLAATAFSRSTRFQGARRGLSGQMRTVPTPGVCEEGRAV